MTHRTPTRRCSVCNAYASERTYVVPAIKLSGIQARFVQFVCDRCLHYDHWKAFDFGSRERHDRFTSKVITLREPWAWLVSNGYKDVENRSTHFNFTGRTFIHSGSSFAGNESFAAAEKVCSQLGILLPNKDELEARMGTIVAVAYFGRMLRTHASIWHTGPWCWPIDWCWPVSSEKIKGQLGVWSLQDTLPITLP